MLGSGSHGCIPKLDASLTPKIDRKPALKIGLTGGIGCGKTTVSKHFEALGIPVIDADIVAREIVQPGKPAYQEIVTTFGANILADDSQLDRKKLRNIVFQNPEKLQQLEKITHPSIISNMDKQVSQVNTSYCILSIPLLLEKDLGIEVDRILIVDIPPAIQKQRVSSRDGISTSQVEDIMENQISREARLKLADDIITNSGSITDLHAQVERLHQKYLELAA